MSLLLLLTHCAALFLCLKVDCVRQAGGAFDASFSKIGTDKVLTKHSFFSHLSRLFTMTSTQKY